MKSLCDYRSQKPLDWSMERALTDPEFFDNYIPGDIAFASCDTGKSVCGFARYVPVEERHRDLIAQKEAGGEDRRANDQGGDLLAIAMGGRSVAENLVPMNARLNQSEYKSLELDLIRKLKAGDDIYVEISAINKDAESERPDHILYNWVSHSNKDGKLDFGCETFRNEHPDDIVEEEVDPAEFDQVMERVMAEIPPLGPEVLEGKDIFSEMPEDLPEDAETAREALAAEFDNMETGGA